MEAQYLAQSKFGPSIWADTYLFLTTEVLLFSDHKAKEFICKKKKKKICLGFADLQITRRNHLVTLVSKSTQRQALLLSSLILFLICYSFDFGGGAMTGALQCRTTSLRLSFILRHSRPSFLQAKPWPHSHCWSHRKVLILFLFYLLSFILHLQLSFSTFCLLSDSGFFCFHLPATPWPSPDWSITQKCYSSKISGPCPSTTSLLLYRSLLFIPSFPIPQALFSVFLYLLKQRSVLVTEELPWAKLGMLEGLDGMFLPLATVLFFFFFLSFPKDCLVFII